MKEQFYFYERAENHETKERLLSFKWLNFPGKHPDAGADQGFLERGFICTCIKVWVRFAEFISFILNFPWKWNNLVSLRPNYFIFIGYLIAGRGRTPWTPSGSATVMHHLLRTEQYWPLQVIHVQLSECLCRGFAHLNGLSIHSFDCIILRSFHSPSRYDFRSNVVRRIK